MASCVLRKDKEAGSEWRKITLEKAVYELEASGYWKKGTAKTMLEEGHELYTAEAEYRLEKECTAATDKLEFAHRVETELRNKIKHNKLSLEKMAQSYGIQDKTEVKELTELAIVNRARAITHTGGTIEEKYAKVVELYENQVNISHRTSMSILLQQYSTPCPISYLCGIFAGADKDISVFEPSAGNGLLTIAANPKNVIVNEVDELRRSNLETQGYKEVLKQDASQAFQGFAKKFDAVLTNPPFGTLDKEVRYDSFGIKTLDHLMALRALDTMKDNGRAAIIIGGHTVWDDKGRVEAGRTRIFFNYLYSRYYVADIINIDGHKLYSRQGTSFNVRLILIDGRKKTPYGAAPVRDRNHDVVVKSFGELYDRVMSQAPLRETPLKAWQYTYEKFLENYFKGSGIKADYRRVHKREIERAIREGKPIPKEVMEEYPELKKQSTSDDMEMEAEALALELELLNRRKGELGAPYQPASESCVVLDTVVPDSMEFETKAALEKIKQGVGGDIDDFVRDRLGYKTRHELCKALSAEQIDAVAMAIYNIEARKQGMIIGDQTGIGKGRVAAAIIRYAVEEGLQPIFITEKANLFSDIYRDLSAIGSAHLVPLIVNARESKTDIKDEDGNVIYQALIPSQQDAIFKDKAIPARYNFIVATYSQFNSPDKKPGKPEFLRAVAENNILILDEAHNSSGSSNTGEFMQSIVKNTQGVVFLSATFAKRPDNMPVYAMKTAMSDANMSKEELIGAIIQGGVALQEILSSQLVAEGQMLRRERSFEGVEVNYITLEEKEQEHRAIADNITDLLREIIAFQINHIDTEIEELDNIAVAEGKEVNIREGTSQAGVDNLPYFSKVFNVINQMLFSIKAESVAERAIERLKEGKKPVIAFASTMGSFIEQMENNKGLPVGDGDVINADFTEVLRRGLDGILRYTETEPDGNKLYKKFEVSELPSEVQTEYFRISEKIRSISTGITISPIDVIVDKIQKAGYSVAEVTGRKYEVQLNRKTGEGLVRTRKRINTNDAFRQFNNNEVDVLLINQSGSTGASAHAIVTPKVPKEEVKQRVMIVLQAELDINTEVQKRGRINRTGQIYKPIYDYVNSAIPAEKRLMMMLQKKLKSLDANTTSNQKQSTKILDVPDFLNKYGDKVVTEYLMENPEINKLLDDPLKLEETENEDGNVLEDAAHKVSGRVAVLSTQMQQDFYNEISQRYSEYVEYLKQIGEYDLEVEAMNLQAETISSRVVKVGKGGESEFGTDSIMETVRANVLKKPFTRTELENVLKESTQGQDTLAQQAEIFAGYEEFTSDKLAQEIEETATYYEKLIKEIPEEKKIQKILEKKGLQAQQEAMEEREKELSAALTASEARINKIYSNRKQYLDGLFKFFYVGRNLNYPVHSFEQGKVIVPSVFLGFVIDRKKKNPYAPSAIKVRLAIANSNKYVAMPASYEDEVLGIKGASTELEEEGLEATLNRWEKSIKESQADRQIRYIISGNLLQAFSQYSGKLVSYTMMDGTVRKGILLPEYWEPEEQSLNKVDVPIERALKIIRSLGQGSQINTNNGLSFFRQGNNYKIIVPGSKAKGGDFFLNQEILKLVEKNNFEKVADKMVATVKLEYIDELVQILQEKFNTSVTLSSFQFDLVKDDAPKIKSKKNIVLKVRNPERADNTEDIELEAMALELELQLLKFAA